MSSYHFFTNYYDHIVRWTGYSLKDEVDMIDEFIKEYLDKDEKVSILEVACWTWVVARELLKRWYDIVWIDISEDMLQKAIDNIWRSRCELADMRDFNLNRNFDVVLCNYNSICHLISLKDWRKFFLQVYNHLNEWGIFIFDINTVYEFESITRDFKQFFTFKDVDNDSREDVVCLEMFKKERNMNNDIILSQKEKEYYYEWLIKMFVHADDGRYDLVIETIAENSFEISEIKKELESFWFKLLHLEDFHRWHVDEESERVYFVTRKV